MVVQAALDHAAQGVRGHFNGFAPGLGRTAALQGGDAQEELQIARAGEFRRAAEAAFIRVEALVEVHEAPLKGIAGGLVQGRQRDGGRGGRDRLGLRHALSRDGARAAGVGHGGGAVFIVLAQGCDHPLGLAEKGCPLVPPGVGDGFQQGGETLAAVAFVGRKIGAPEKRFELGGQPDVQRPAARAGAGLHVGHVNAVHVGALLAVEFDRHEILVQLGGDGGVFKTLVRHDVAPVAGGVADGEQDGFVLGAGAGKGGLAPLQPIHGIIGMLAKVGRLGGGEGVGHECPQ